jgi:hypothetical protein
MIVNPVHWFYQIGDITLQVESDLQIAESTFHSNIQKFRVSPSEKDVVKIRHHFNIPDINKNQLGYLVYKDPPWEIYTRENAWTSGLHPALRRHDPRRARLRLRRALRGRQIDHRRNAAPARRDPVRRPQHPAALSRRLAPLRHLVPRRRARRLAQLGPAARHPAARAGALQPPHSDHGQA